MCKSQQENIAYELIFCFSSMSCLSYMDVCEMEGR